MATRRPTGAGRPAHSDGSAAFDRIVTAFARDRRVEPPAPARGAFGSNGLKVDGRIFAMLVRGALVVKLPRERVEALIRSGRAEPFDAGRGRAMKEWATVRGSEPGWLALAKEALEYVGRGSAR